MSLNKRQSMDALDYSPDLEERLAEPLEEKYVQLLDKALLLEKWPIAQLVSIFERETPEHKILRHQILRHLEQRKLKRKPASVFGFTGTPGAGKSTLVGELCSELLEQRNELSIAVVAIDPSSHQSGGSLLGDRTRMRFPIQDKRIYFRSQASHQDLGGMGRMTFQITRFLRNLFDIIIIETVGIGQSEIEIEKLSDHTLLVMQPLAGDQVQFIKAGIMEIPDSFIVNKCDEEALAKQSLHRLKASLKLTKLATESGHEDNSPSVFMTSAIKKKGTQELSQHLIDLHENQTSDFEKRFSKVSQYFLEKAVRQDFGLFGTNILRDSTPDNNAHQSSHSYPSNYELHELAFRKSLSGLIKR